jgi:hypothetical protein
VSSTVILSAPDLCLVKVVGEGAVGSKGDQYKS